MLCLKDGKDRAQSDWKPNSGDNEKCVADIPILTEGERHQVLYEWNDTRAAYPDACVHELFEEQAARNPDAVAVVFKERKLSYRELNQRANQVAHYLRRCGVGPEILVGVCFERSPEMVIALLGVWKAGGAYVPLDPAYPQKRLSFMVSDAGAKVLLTDIRCKTLFPPAYYKVVCLDSDWQVIVQESTSNPTAVTIPSNLAYVMYTSGSTGQPKGAMILHSGLVNYLCWAIKAYAVEAGSSVPVHTSVSFDLTVTSLYPPLLTGGQVELLPEDVGAQSLVTALRQVKNRGLVKITPAHLELLSRQLSPEETAGMTKTFVIGGENLFAESLCQWRDFAPATRLINEYGPTETVVGCCVYEVKAEDPRNGSVPIGRPISNTQLYVLDHNLQPVPPGVTGELYIGGDGVARGYLNRPELTQERFLVDPFSGRSGARLYKTGDLARYRKDGTLECLGRLDDQLKVRGYRIELGEIEASLRRKRGVRDVVILPYTNQQGEKRISAFVVREPGFKLSVKELRRFLRQELPEIVIPSRCFVLEQWPLTPSGKVDRQALVAILAAGREISSANIPPRTALEKQLVPIWEQILGCGPIGIQDNFFDLGGDSLDSVRLLAQIEKVFDKRLPIASLLGAATVEQFAALLLQEESRDRLAYALPIQSEGDKPIFFCVGAGPLLRPLSVQLGSEQPFFSVGIKPGAVERLKGPYQIEELAQHVVLALREKQPEGPYYLGGFCENGLFAYEVTSQLTAQGQSVGLLALFETENPRPIAKARVAIGLRRMIIRLRFRVNQLRKIRISEIPVYARSRWEEFRLFLTRISWRASRHFPRVKRQLGRADLERILFLAASAYKPKPLGCPTVIFRCTDWPIAAAGDPYFGWRGLLAGRCKTYEVPGDHIGMFSESNVKVLADQLRTCLHNAR